jgi:serine O-acetyltransferase
MITSLDTDSLILYLTAQLNHLFPDHKRHNLRRVVPHALDRLEKCLSRVKLPAYHVNDNIRFDHLHSEQYASFLYLASNVAWREAGDTDLAAKLFCLNKALNGMICMYDTTLPDYFLIVHSVGIMLGKATYSDYLVVHQNVTVGTDRGRQPRLGEGVVICGGAAIIGNCEIGENVSVSVHSTVLNSSVPAGHVVAGRSPDLKIKPAKRRLVCEYFDMEADGKRSLRKPDMCI